MARLAEMMERYDRHQRATHEPPMGVQRLAELSGIPDRTVYRHARNETSMSLEQAIAYARVLGCSVEELSKYPEQGI